MTEAREPYGPPVTLDPPAPDAPGALLLGPLGCPECGATMANMSDDHATICCMAPGCALRYVAFWRPTVPLQRASQPRPVFRPYEDFRAELVAEGRLPGKSTTSIDANGLGLDLSAYIGEECRLCGQELTAEDAAEATWAGDRARQSLCAMAHRRCWNGLVEVAGDLGFDVRAAVARLYGSPSPQAEGKGATLLDALVENLRLTANTNGREIVERLLQFSDDRHNLFLWEVRTFAKAAIAMLREGAE